VTIRLSCASTALVAAFLALAAGGRAASAQARLVDPATGLRGFSSQSSAGTLAPATTPSSADVLGTPSGSTTAGSMAPAETTAGLTRPRQIKPNSTRPAKQGKAKLPALVAYRTAPGASARTGSGNKAAVDAPAPNVAALPYPAPQRRPREEADPYAPLGVRAGGLVLRPSVEIDGGYNDNPNGAVAKPKGSSFGRVGGALDAQSDWARHEFKANLRGGYNRYFKTPDADRPDLQGTASLRLDATRDTSVLIEGKANVDSQRPGSPEVTSLGTRGATVTGRPLIYQEGVAAGVTQKFGRFEATLRGSVDRTDYQDANLSDGAKVMLSNESFSSYGASLRLGYEATPGVKPFVEASIDRRAHDNAKDLNGFKRDSTGVTGRVGTSFELTRTLTGEASAGYTQRHYEDGRLKDLRGPVVDAALIWSATPLTTLTLKGSTSFDETNIAGSTGSINNKASVQISHALLRNLTLVGVASFGQRDYQGYNLKEKTLSLGLSADYALTRSVVVRGSFTHDRLKSTAPNADYTANVFLLGLKLQR
jgi:hypothetical protein